MKSQLPSKAASTEDKVLCRIASLYFTLFYRHASSIANHLFLVASIVKRVGKRTLHALRNHLLDALRNVRSARLVHSVADALSLGVLTISACGVVNLVRSLAETYQQNN